MADMSACEHETMVDDEPIQSGRHIHTGRVCVACGLQTVRFETYVPVSKSCPSCPRTFEGLSDDPGEVCNDCLLDRLMHERFGA